MSAPAPALREVQLALHSHLLGLPSGIVESLCDDGPISTARRLQIYHDAYRSRLREALQDNFEKTWTYLGDAGFTAAADACIGQMPPQQRNLRWYGGQFVDWLAASFPADPEVAELALIDWRMRAAFDGPDAAPVAASALGRLSGEDWIALGCRFVPTLFIAPLRFNTIAIWNAIDRDEPPPMLARLTEPAWLLLWRKSWQPHFRTIAAAEHAALERLRAGGSVAGLCAALSVEGSAAQTAADVAAWLRRWLDEELIAELTEIDPE